MGNEQINWLWTGFQLINQTHFKNSQNQSIQGNFVVDHGESSTKYFSCRKSRSKLEFNNVRISCSCYQEWVISSCLIPNVKFYIPRLGSQVDRQTKVNKKEVKYPWNWWTRTWAESHSAFVWAEKYRLMESPDLFSLVLQCLYLF